VVISLLEDVGYATVELLFSVVGVLVEKKGCLQGTAREGLSQRLL